MDNLDKKPAPGMVRAYFDRVGVFKPNAWLYLSSVFAVALVIRVLILVLSIGSMAIWPSLYSMIWRLGRSFSPTVSGYLQKDYGFGPPFAMAIALYTMAIFMHWYFFLRGGRQGHYEVVPALSK